MSLWNSLPNLPLKRPETLTQEYGEMFERFARDFFSPQLDGEDYGFRPKVEVEETEKGYRVSAELPGLREENIHLTLRDNSLILEGKKESLVKDEKKRYYRSEFRYGRFHRAIPLRSDVDDTKIKATFVDGVLRVDLVKKDDGIEKVHRIPINQH